MYAGLIGADRAGRDLDALGNSEGEAHCVYDDSRGRRVAVVGLYCTSPYDDVSGWTKVGPGIKLDQIKLVPPDAELLLPVYACASTDDDRFNLTVNIGEAIGPSTISNVCLMSLFHIDRDLDGTVAGLSYLSDVSQSRGGQPLRVDRTVGKKLSFYSPITEWWETNIAAAHPKCGVQRRWHLCLPSGAKLKYKRVIPRVRQLA
jgi:hypothetical protein